MTPPPGPHEVVRALWARQNAGSLPGARTDGRRIALAIEGGGQRGDPGGGGAPGQRAAVGHIGQLRVDDRRGAGSQRGG